ncbi:MAG: hypothetical protein ACI9GO_000656, partial [Bacteroidia bacterium]
MSKTIRLSSFLMLLYTVNTTAHANSIVDKYTERIATEQHRIDILDGTEDRYVRLKSDIQSSQATGTYIVASQRITDKILSNGLLPDVQKGDQLKRVYELLKDVNSKNVHFYTQFSPV